MLDRLTLVDLIRADLVVAPLRAAGLRSQDALHLTVALRAGADVVITDDAEPAAAATTIGLPVLQPA